MAELTSSQKTGDFFVIFFCMNLNSLLELQENVLSSQLNVLIYARCKEHYFFMWKNIFKSRKSFVYKSIYNPPPRPNLRVIQ